ncbi:dipeptidyl-peptidase 3 family protein [Chryseobacterium sp. MP_3.2]|uniref:dipeptidyl-peptidase 3 family protein n=1 Tax=Chryseobacterium sp. MP_3.2 TaxID=3071712 RepID=UPI002E0093DC|nr:dipeptidyl-peptidase-3 [Chryseobacterium sp. MP_3.2]
MKRSKITLLALASVLVFSCTTLQNTSNESTSQEESQNTSNSIDRFADIEVLKYEVPGWKELTLKEKEYVYYLSQAGYAGRDMIYDQNYKHNLKIRRALENVYQNFTGNKNTEDWRNFELYLKRVWFANGIHHHYSNEKMKPTFSKAYFEQLLQATKTKMEPQVADILFNNVDNKKVNLDLSKGLLRGSAVNFYGEDVSSEEAERFYAAMKSPDSKRPLSTGLNSQLVQENGKISEKVWKSGGMYGSAIDQVVYWLGKAKTVTENQKQAEGLALLIQYYKTGDLKTWDDYNTAWVSATEGNIDYINGFIEVYNDPLGHKGSYESVVQIKDFDMSRKMEVLSKEAQWFEDHTPLMPQHKKKNVVGVSYKTVIVASEAGDSSPSTPIGVNLPNADWIRAEHGSKSISLGNIIDAYNQAGGSGRLKEFVNDSEELRLAEKYGELSSKLHTALHEVVGHASGQINPGVGTPKETLKSYASTMEEGRADLVGLYFLYDPKLQELGLVDDWKALGTAAYDNYIRNGLMMQLVRLEPGADIEESHMRNRQWVSAWVFEKGKKDNVIEKVMRDGKTYFNINNYEKLHDLFGQLLRETQRIKSEGDYNAAKNLVENYGVKVDQAIHKEVLARNAKYKEAAYRGFVNPYITPVKNTNGKVTDYVLKYPKTFSEQMLQYAKEYSFLPDHN